MRSCPSFAIASSASSSFSSVSAADGYIDLASVQVAYQLPHISNLAVSEWRVCKGFGERQIYV